MLMQKVDAISQMMNRLLQLRRQSQVRRASIEYRSLQTRMWLGRDERRNNAVTEHLSTTRRSLSIVRTSDQSPEVHFKLPTTSHYGERKSRSSTAMALPTWAGSVRFWWVALGRSLKFRMFDAMFRWIRHSKSRENRSSVGHDLWDLLSAWPSRILSEYRQPLIEVSRSHTTAISKCSHSIDSRKKKSFSLQPITGPECVMMSRALSAYISQLQYRLQEAIIYQVSDDFMDITSTIKTLREAASRTSGKKRLKCSDKKSLIFVLRWIQSTRTVSNSDTRVHQSFVDPHSNSTSSCQRDFVSIEIDYRSDQYHRFSSQLTSSVDTISVLTLSTQINDLTPQVIYAARIVFGDPKKSSITEEHFDLLQEQWVTQMEYLRRQVDEAIPCDEFVKACGSFLRRPRSSVTNETSLVEEAIIHDTQQTEKAIADRSPPVIVESTSNIIRRANRVLLVTYQEIENSEDSIFNTQLQRVSDTLKQSIFSTVLRWTKDLNAFAPHRFSTDDCGSQAISSTTWE